MNMRNDWTISENNYFSDTFYNKEESIQSVKDNFDLRRYNTAEGYDIEINGVMERCLVQTSSNPLRELNDYRKIHCPITSDVRRGYYVKYEGSIWLIDTNVVNVDNAYLSTRMSRCQYALRWQNFNGDIITRWGYASDQTKYSSGETGNNTITIGDNQYGLLLPIDSETKRLKRDMRFAIDFDDSDKPDIYKLTNRKVKLNDETHENRGGTMTIALSFDAFNPSNDKRITLEDGRQVWICDYTDTNTPIQPTEPTNPTDPSNPSSPNETTDLRVNIKGSTNLKIGFSRTYTATVIDEDGNDVVWNDTFSWNVISNFDVTQELCENKIKLTVEDDSLIGESFLLQVIHNSKVLKEIEITVADIV